MDRFYPMGLYSPPENWKTSYELQNEMKTHERSPYPPGTSVHQPGSRDHFGFGTPGPNPALTTKSSFALTEDPDAVAAMHGTEMTAFAGSSPMAQTGAMMMTSPASFRRTSSQGALHGTRRTPKRLADKQEPIHSLEDDTHTFFVPNSMKHSGEDRLAGNFTLPKLSKEKKLVATFGEGTGFKSQGAGADWWPQGSYDKDMPSQYRMTHGGKR